MTRFLDTNILVYAQTTEARAQIAYDQLKGGYVLAVQTLNEFAWVARRKLGLPWETIDQASQRFVAHAIAVLPTLIEDHRLSLHLAARYNVNVFDALLLAIGLRAGCDTFVTEDMQNGQIIGGALKIQNPFL